MIKNGRLPFTGLALAEGVLLSEEVLVIEAGDLFVDFDIVQDLEAGGRDAGGDKLAVGPTVVVEVGARAEPELRAALAARVHDAEVVDARRQNGLLLGAAHLGYAAHQALDLLVLAPGARRHYAPSAPLLARVAARALAHRYAALRMVQMQEAVEVGAEGVELAGGGARRCVLREPRAAATRYRQLVVAALVVVVRAEALDRLCPLDLELAPCRPEARVHLVGLEAEHRVHREHCGHVIQLAELTGDQHVAAD